MTYERTIENVAHVAASTTKEVGVAYISYKKMQAIMGFIIAFLFLTVFAIAMFMGKVKFTETFCCSENGYNKCTSQWDCKRTCVGC